MGAMTNRASDPLIPRCRLPHGPALFPGQIVPRPSGIAGSVG
jgi:hypothetical protein